MLRTTRWLALLGAGAAALVAAATAGWAKTYPDPQAPSVPMHDWRAIPGLRTLETEFGRHALRLPLQAVTEVQTTRDGSDGGERVVALSVELTLPELRTVGLDTRDRFRAPDSPQVLWLRLHAAVPPGVMERYERNLALSVQRGFYQEVTQGGWEGLRLYAMTDRRQPPVMEGFFGGDGGRRYVECRLASPQPGCSATYQHDDGLTVEYSFGLGYLGRMAWLDAEVTKLLASFVTR